MKICFLNCCRIDSFLKFNLLPLDLSESINLLTLIVVIVIDVYQF